MDDLRTWRLRRRFTQEQLAAAAGVSAKGLQNLEHGRTQPRRATVRVLAQALQVSEADIFPENDESRAANAAPSNREEHGDDVRHS